jgi:transportin-3
MVQEGQLSDLTPVMHLIVVLHSGSPQIDPGLMHLVHKSAAQVVGSYSGWIHNFPTAVLPLLSFLAAGLTVPLAAGASAAGLRKLCEDVPDISQEPSNIEGLLRIGEEVHAVQLSLQEEEDVMCAVGRVLSTVTSSIDVNSALERLLKPTHAAMETLLETDSEGSLRLHSAAYAASLEAGIRAVHRLGVLFSQLMPSSNGDGPILRVVAHFWPLFERLLSSRHMEDSGLALATCRSLSHAIQASGRQFSSLLPNVLTAMYKNFLSFQSHVCFIRTGKI